MKKLFLFMMVSLDGYFEGENHDLSWHNVDSEFVDFAIEQTKNVGTLLFGRRTYELMRDFWPTEEARQEDPQTAELMNNTPKIVFSKTMDKVGETDYWKNVRLIKDNAEEEVRRLKGGEGKDLAVYGSSNFCLTLIRAGLLNELRIMVNPVVIGKGTTLFEGLEEKFSLRLTETRNFKSGNILLTYQCIDIGQH